MPQAEVGRASAFVSGFILIATAAQLHVGVALLIWIPSAKRRSGELVLRTCLVVGPLAVGTAVVYALLAPSLAETAALAVDGALPVGVLIFAVAGNFQESLPFALSVPEAERLPERFPHVASATRLTLPTGRGLRDRVMSAAMHLPVLRDLRFSVSLLTFAGAR